MAKARVDLSTVAGLTVATAGILGGLLLEGGALQDVLQKTAALIVLGGTAGAVMVATPWATLTAAMRRLWHVLMEPQSDPGLAIDEIITFATKARRSGLVSLDGDINRIPDPFMRKALTLAVDGCDLQELRKMMELEIDMAEGRAEAEAQVFESAGGYSPTIGIIGAVLGLIQVMKRLADTEQVGHGIATAFVATVYGVALANVVLLPAAAKIKARMRQETDRRMLILEGICGLVEGLNPKLIRQKLEAFVAVTGQTRPAAAKPAARREAA
ncbi:MAG: flagellar motor protein [Acidobacteria bacterium]|nr:flagellar motor protein [Acidobacteriota bacterium]